MRISLNAADRLSLAFLAVLGTLTVIFIPALPSWQALLGLYSLLGAAIVALAWHRLRNPLLPSGFYLHVAFTVGMILLLFNSLGDIIPYVNPNTYDDLLIRIDHALFGVHPTVWIERMVTPARTAFLQVAYISYYFIPVSLGFLLIAKGRKKEFGEALFGIVLCFYLSYIGYLLVPAVGPRFTLNDIQTIDLQAGPFIALIRETLDSMEHNKTDAFPSGHTAIALVSLFYAWKLKEKVLSGILLPLVLALIISTVYLRYHYVIDVVAGIVLAGLVLVLAPFLGRLLSGTAAHAGKQHHDSA